MIELYDKSGRAVVHSNDGEHLYSWRGKPVGYIERDKVYSYTGRFIGWFENGWLYDSQNRPLLFTGGASGGPVKPVRAVKSVKGVKQVKPLKSMKPMTPMRPVRSMSWSPLVWETAFHMYH